MNALRIWRPISVRIGMFCRLGSLLLNRPVAATAWLTGVHAPGFRIHQRRQGIDIGAFSFARPRQSRITLRSSCDCASSSSTSTAVEAVRVRAGRFSTGSFSLSNRTSASCFGELMLNSRRPAVDLRAELVSARDRAGLRRQRLHVDPHAALRRASARMGISGNSSSR